MEALLFQETPLIESYPLTAQQQGQARVFLKLDGFLPSGSYKFRGVSVACQKAKQAGCSSFVTSSGGNAGHAVAVAGKELGVPVLVVVPETAPEHMRQRILAQGAKLVVHGKVWNEADVLARKMLAEQQGGVYIHPFDHPDLWLGHSTIITEVASHKLFQGIKPSVIVCSVGGGGMLVGICQGLRKVGWEDVPIVAVETFGANCLAVSRRANQVTTLPGITSIAKTLGALAPCQESFDWAQRHSVISCEVEDKDVVQVMSWFLRDHNMLLEPACAAALVPVYFKRPELMGLKPTRILVQVCGGQMATIDNFREWKEQFGVQ
jgi:L-serine/L-threonine ammonia-lyase